MAQQPFHTTPNSVIAASFGDHPAVVSALLLAGADPSVENAMGITGREEV